MIPLTLPNVLNALSQQITLHFQQQSTADRPEGGALVRPDWGLDDPVQTAGFVARCGYLLLARALAPSIAPTAPEDRILLKRAHLAIDYLLRVQRPSGLIDLRDCNYDSSPDAGFATQMLCSLLELERLLRSRELPFAQLMDKIEQFVRRAVSGMLTGGFHTPNHRWVVACALAQASALFPDLIVKPVVESYLNEGFDADEEGFYIERSTGVYDAVCDRSLLLLAEFAACPAACAAARRNLETHLTLWHADGSVETGLSRRQDAGTRCVPVGLAPSYLISAHAEPDSVFVRAAEFLWNALPPTQQETLWLCYALLKYGETLPSSVALPDCFSRHFPLNGLWRVRNGQFSASVFRDSTHLMSLRFGQAELRSLQISQSYFGVGQFQGEALIVEEDGATLRSEGTLHPRRPGYDLPLDRPVPPERWRELTAQRAHRPLPPCRSELTLRLTSEGVASTGFALRYKTHDNLPGVTAQIACDFPPGGIWETEDICLKPEAGQTLFLKRGWGAMRYGNDLIEIGPGADAHRMWQMRDAEPAPDAVRVLLTLRTPIDHAFTLRARRM